MDVELIRKHRLAHPFEPFTVVLKDGRRFPITQPYFLAMSMSGSEVAVSAGPRKFEHFAAEDVDRIELGANSAAGAHA